MITLFSTNLQHYDCTGPVLALYCASTEWQNLRSAGAVLAPSTAPVLHALINVVINFCYQYFCFETFFSKIFFSTFFFQHCFSIFFPQRLHVRCLPVNEDKTDSSCICVMKNMVCSKRSELDFRLVWCVEYSSSARTAHTTLDVKNLISPSCCKIYYYLNKIFIWY